MLRASARTADGEGWQGSAGPKAELPLKPQRLPDVEAGRAGGGAGRGQWGLKAAAGGRGGQGPREEQAWGCREGHAASPLPPSSRGPERSSPEPQTQHRPSPGSRRGLVGWTGFLTSLRAVNECRAETEERRSVSKCVRRVPGPGHYRNGGQTLLPTLAAPPVLEGAGRGHTHPQGQGSHWTVGA